MVSKPPEIEKPAKCAGGAIDKLEPDHEEICVALDGLPERLTMAASRCCRDLYGDGPSEMAAMLDGLRHYPPDIWPWLADHFRRQLPDPPTTLAASERLRGEHDAIINAVLIGRRGGRS